MTYDEIKKQLLLDILIARTKQDIDGAVRAAESAINESYIPGPQKQRLWQEVGDSLKTQVRKQDHSATNDLMMQAQQAIDSMAKKSA